MLPRAEEVQRLTPRPTGAIPPRREVSLRSQPSVAPFRLPTIPVVFDIWSQDLAQVCRLRSRLVVEEPVPNLVIGSLDEDIDAWIAPRGHARRRGQLAAEVLAMPGAVVPQVGERITGGR